MIEPNVNELKIHVELTMMFKPHKTSRSFYVCKVRYIVLCLVKWHLCGERAGFCSSIKNINN